MPRPDTYDPISRLNPWIIAAAMIGMLGLGLYLEYGGLERESNGPLIAIHKSVGVQVLAFGLWRVAWRRLQGFPHAASRMSDWQERLSKIAHWALLSGILIMPVSGIASSVFRGRPVDVFGWFLIPAQTEAPWLATAASTAHTFVGVGLTIMVLAHIAAVLKHHFLDQDRTLTRMLAGDPRRE